MDNSASEAARQDKTKTFLMDKELITKDLHHTAAARGERTDDKTQPKIRIKTPG